ncbi:MAG: hypothetical protein IJK35_06800 [Oscillospiraceae bacterium]|nr:hypothetical protein [Oscillospiraceae bacterium]
MSKKREIPMQFILPFSGGAVNQCCYVDPDELEEKAPGEKLPALLDKALAGKLSPRSLTRYRAALLREAIGTDRADALPLLLPKRRLEPALFAELFALAEGSDSPDARAALLAYRGAHYAAAEFDALEQRQIDLELGLAEPESADWRKLYRLRYQRGGVSICGLRAARRVYEIPAAIGDKPVTGVDAACFYAPDPMPRVWRSFAPGISRVPSSRELSVGERVYFGRSLEKKASAETPIPWRVLCRKEGRALLFCERAAAVLPYHAEQEEVTWAGCRLRHWLNTVFLPLSFTEAERDRILQVSVETPDNRNFATPGGDAAEDRLFLLSTEEAAGLLPDDASRALGCWWWLRTPGFDNSFAATVTPAGSVVRIGSFVDADDYAVRPALWLRVEE